MQETPADTDTRPRMEALVGLASQIVRRGYGESVIDLALRRKGASKEVSRLVAASVASCYAAVLTTRGDAGREQEAREAIPKPDLRAARAASLALSKIVSFVAFVIVGIGGGAFFGWSIGFSQGVDDGFDWLVRAVEQLIAR